MVEIHRTYLHALHVGTETRVSVSVASYRLLILWVTTLKYKDLLNLLRVGLVDVTDHHHAYLFFLDGLPHSFTSMEKQFVEKKDILEFQTCLSSMMVLDSLYISFQVVMHILKA